ncbi:MAG TPA: hypothetical protein VIY90_08700 [Steroidobacteraceae bacterium]
MTTAAPPCTANELQPEARASAHRWTMLALACLSAAFLMLIHPYRGLEHDSVLYTVLALARLHPAALGHDLFVRYGAQDHYTIFSPMYAAAIQAVGLERAAAIMTFATYIAFFGSIWLLARRLMSASNALLALGLLLVLPSWYGSNSVFAYIEAFLTPRQSAEAFALAGIAAALSSRHILAGVCMVVALLLHPIIAAAGITLWIILFPGFARPRVAALVIGMLGIALIGLSATGIGPFAHFDASWLNILQTRLAYLFPTRWSVSEWVAMGIRAAVLVVGVGYSKQELVRRLCVATLVTLALGMSFAIVESDWLHVIVAAQMQTWRWLWLLGVLSVLLAPSIAIDCWRAGGLGRAAAVLLLSAWLTRSDHFAILPMVLACLAAAMPAAVRDSRQAQLIQAGAYILLAASLVILVGEIRNTLPQLDVIRAGHRPYLVRIGEAQALAYGGLLPAVLLALVRGSENHLTRHSAVLLAALGAVLLLSVLPYGVQTWTQSRYPKDRYQAFAPWRAAIPESAEILWPDPPPVAWFELGRASYWSLYQMAGMVFSRDVTMVSTRRETAVTPVLPLLGRALTGTRHYSLTASPKDRPGSLETPCRLPGVTFYASWINLGPTAYPPVAPDDENPHEMLYLYRCSSDRH